MNILVTLKCYGIQRRTIVIKRLRSLALKSLKTASGLNPLFTNDIFSVKSKSRKT